MSHSVWPHRWQPARLPCHWDSPGKDTGVGCHFLLLSSLHQYLILRTVPSCSRHFTESKFPEGMCSILLMIKDLCPPGARLGTGLDLPLRIALLFSLQHTLFPEPTVLWFVLVRVWSWYISINKQRQGSGKSVILPPPQEGILGSACHLVSASCSGGLAVVGVVPQQADFHF